MKRRRPDNANVLLSAYARTTTTVAMLADQLGMSHHWCARTVEAFRRARDGRVLLGDDRRQRVVADLKASGRHRSGNAA